MDKTFHTLISHFQLSMLWYSYHFFCNCKPHKLVLELHFYFLKPGAHPQLSAGYFTYLDVAPLHNGISYKCLVHRVTNMVLVSKARWLFNHPLSDTLVL